MNTFAEYDKKDPFFVGTIGYLPMYVTTVTGYIIGERDYGGALVVLRVVSEDLSLLRANRLPTMATLSWRMKEIVDLCKTHVEKLSEYYLPEYMPHEKAQFVPCFSRAQENGLVHCVFIISVHTSE